MADTAQAIGALDTELTAGSDASIQFPVTASATSLANSTNGTANASATVDDVAGVVNSTATVGNNATIAATVTGSAIATAVNVGDNGTNVDTAIATATLQGDEGGFLNGANGTDTDITAGNAATISATVGITERATLNILRDLEDEGYSPGVVSGAQSGGSFPVTLDGATEPRLFTRDNLLSVERSQALPFEEALRQGARVRVPYDDDDAPLTKRRWYYGVVVGFRDEAQLVSIDFDNGEELRDAPLFDVHFVASPPAKRPRGRSRS
jgi:hypothetical protein